MKCEPSLKDFKRAAEYVASSFTCGERDDLTGSPVVVVRSGRTDVRDAVRGVHPDGILPADMLYRWCQEAADIIEGGDDMSDADDRISEWSHEWPIYTAEGRRWSCEAEFDHFAEEAVGLASLCDLDGIIGAAATAARETCARAMCDLVVELASGYCDADAALAEEEREEERDEEVTP
jgi:hypothetical protein